MLLDAGPPQHAGVTNPRIAFGEEDKAERMWAGRRLLTLDGSPAFNLSFWCGTCQFLFERLEGANTSLSLEETQARLNDGIDSLDQDVIDRFTSLLGEDDYAPFLLAIEPRLVTPSQPGDYFAEEQVTTWGTNGFWGLPEYPHTPYYRTFETAVNSESHLYEFVVPMVPPSWNDSGRVAEFVTALAASSRPTAVAVSLLDVCAPAVDTQSTDYHEHWGLTHFLLDGHHKVQAAAESGSPMRLLSLLAVGASLATPEQVATVASIRQRPASNRANT